MSLNNNIEELFKAKLDNFESPVNDAMWSNISNSLGTTAASTATSTSIIGKLFSTTGIAISTGIVCTVATVLIMSSEDNNAKVSESANPVVLIEHIDETNQPVTNDDEIAVNNIVNATVEQENDPVIKVNEVEKFIVRPDVSEGEDKEGYVKEPSYVRSFLTPQNRINQTKDIVDLKKDTSQKLVLNTISIVKANEDDLIATIIASPVGGYAPLDVYFSNPATRGSVHWNFGDGTSSDDFSPSHTFEKYGTYMVELTITDENGNERKDYRVIEVEANSAITVLPNVFTPNGDGINDLCTVKGKNLDTFQMKVFNRSGDVIFETESIDNSWDGKNKFGENISTGTYFYLISARGIDGKVYEHTGTITLSR